jgi:hypothetical protein
MGAFQQIESGGDPTQQTGKYKGLYQLDNDEYARYGGRPGMIFDPAENTRIAHMKIADEGTQLAQKLGRPITDSEAYLAHQQGVGGAFAHLSNPDQPAWMSMASTGEGRARGTGWARQAIWGNIPDQYKAQFGNVDNVSSGQFTNMWNNRFARAMGNPVTAINTAAGIKPRGGNPALAMADTEDNDTEQPAQPIMGQPPGALSPGQWKQLLAADKPDRMSTMGSMMAQAGAALAGIANPTQGYVLSGLAKQLTEAGNNNYKYMMGADGTMYRTNNLGGIEAIGTNSAKGKHFTPFKYKDKDGFERAGVVDQQGQFHEFGGDGNGAPAGPQIGGDPNLTGQDRFNSMSKADQDMATAFNEGRAPLITQQSLKNNPKLAAQFAGAQAAFPGLDLNTASARRTFLSDRAKNTPSSLGGSLEIANTAMDQLDNLTDLYGQMRNVGVNDTIAPYFKAQSAEGQNAIYNSIHSDQKRPMVDQIKTLAKNSSADINKLQVAGPGSERERSDIEEGLNAPNSAPEVQAGKLMGHIKSLEATINARMDHERTNLGDEFVKNDPVFKRYTEKLDALKAKVSKLYSGDTSFVPEGNGITMTPRGAAPAAPFGSWDEAQKAGWK